MFCVRRRCHRPAFPTKFAEPTANFVGSSRWLSWHSGDDQPGCSLPSGSPSTATILLSIAAYWVWGDNRGVASSRQSGQVVRVWSQPLCQSMLPSTRALANLPPHPAPKFRFLRVLTASSVGQVPSLDWAINEARGRDDGLVSVYSTLVSGILKPPVQQTAKQADMNAPTFWVWECMQRRAAWPGRLLRQQPPDPNPISTAPVKTVRTTASE